MQANRVALTTTSLPVPGTQLVRLSDVAFAIVFVSIDNAAPSLSHDRAAIAPRPTGSAELVCDDFSDYDDASTEAVLID